MARRLPQRLGAFDAAADFASRLPWEWQREACGLLAGHVRLTKAPPGLEAHVARCRAQALQDVRAAAATLLRDATRRAQMRQRGVGTLSEARFYGPVRPDQIHAQVDHTLAHILALGPKRTLRQALKDAAALLGPGELWNEGDGWRSLGAAAGARRGGSAPQPQRKVPRLGAGYGAG